MPTMATPRPRWSLTASSWLRLRKSVSTGSSIGPVFRPSRFATAWRSAHCAHRTLSMWRSLSTRGRICCNGSPLWRSIDRPFPPSGTASSDKEKRLGFGNNSPPPSDALRGRSRRVFIGSTTIRPMSPQAISFRHSTRLRFFPLMAWGTLPAHCLHAAADRSGASWNASIFLTRSDFSTVQSRCTRLSVLRRRIQDHGVSTLRRAGVSRRRCGGSFDQQPRLSS